MEPYKAKFGYIFSEQLAELITFPMMPMTMVVDKKNRATYWVSKLAKSPKKVKKQVFFRDFAKEREAHALTRFIKTVVGDCMHRTFFASCM